MQKKQKQRGMRMSTDAEPAVNRMNGPKWRIEERKV